MSDEIFISLGIDFGTRFTKVCARSEGIGTVACDFGKSGINSALIPSVIQISGDGHLVVPDAGSDPDLNSSISYLKMALADRGDLKVGASLRGFVQRGERLARGLSAHFLAEVLNRSKSFVLEEWQEHIGDREVVWSANVGLPVEYCDAPIAETFQEVLATAWTWSETNAEPRLFVSVEVDYMRDAQQIDPEMSYCQTYPEIAAAVLSFATSRSATEGIYSYFDIGGGTLDGVVFRLRRADGDVEINFYAGEVASLGVEWLAREMVHNTGGARDDEEQLEKWRRTLLSRSAPQKHESLDRFTSEIQKMASGVIYNGKRKEPTAWRQSLHNLSASRSYLRRSLPDKDILPIPIFLGGGGVNSNFYQSALVGTYEARNLKAWGIPPLELREVPAPQELDLRSIAPEDYHRMLVAFGLSVPFGEGPEVRLPSRFEVVKPKRRKRSDIPDYADHKAMFD